MIDQNGKAMIEGIIGKKLGMTQIFRENGQAEAVTAIEAGPCTVLQVKTMAKDGYTATKLGFSEVKRRKSPRKGRSKEATTFKHLREFSVFLNYSFKNKNKTE